MELNKSIFDFQDYKPYLIRLIESQQAKGRGFRARMAEVMGCQKSFVTKVLAPNSKADLSLEQVERLNLLLGHDKDQSNFMLLLVQYSRAGTPGLRDHFREQMKEILNRRLRTKKEVQSRTVLSPEDHMRYYSAWYYAAIRVAVSVPELQTAEAICEKLALPKTTVASALDFLSSRGLIEKKGNRYVHQARQQIHLSSDHSMIQKHHSNWRTRALSSLDRELSSDLHYSYVVALSEHDALRIRAYLVRVIQDVIKRASPSKEETVYAFGLDYFEL